MKISLD